MKLTVASSPHIRGDFRTSRIMLDVVIALLPVGITAQYSGDDPDIRLIIGPFRRKSKPSGINYLELIDTLYAEEPMPGTQNGDPPSVLKRFLSQIRSLLMLLSEARRVVRVQRLDLKIVLGGDDPCDRVDGGLDET